jgi:hypothetical protein
MRPEIYKYSAEISKCELLILAAGFEERAFQFISKSTFSENAFCILVIFENNSTKNQEICYKFRERVKTCFDDSRIIEIKISPDKPQKYESDLELSIPKLPYDNGDAWVDISGLPTYAICTTLNVLRSYFKNRPQVIIYTAAKCYFPTFEEYEMMSKKSSGHIEFLPKTMAMEMADVSMFETFSGHRSKEGVSCLAILAGYDSLRSAGVIERLNPSMLLLLYGKPASPDLSWRLNLSKELHKKFESTRRTATEEVSTLDLNETILYLERYYENLFEDYDFTISPICSKMQVVGVFLFWERYKEVQLVFPLPVGYDFDRRPRGTGTTYITCLEPRNSLYHNLENS